MRSYRKNCDGDFVGYEVGSVPIIFKEEALAIEWCMETACTLAKERYAVSGYKGIGGKQ